MRLSETVGRSEGHGGLRIPARAWPVDHDRSNFGLRFIRNDLVSIPECQRWARLRHFARWIGTNCVEILPDEALMRRFRSTHGRRAIFLQGHSQFTSAAHQLNDSTTSLEKTDGRPPLEDASGVRGSREVLCSDCKTRIDVDVKPHPGEPAMRTAYSETRCPERRVKFATS